jgi:hypothetical protein
MNPVFAAVLCLFAAIGSTALAQEPTSHQQVGETAEPRQTVKSFPHLQPPAKASPIPIFEFADTLEEQEKQLAANPYLRRVNGARGSGR